MYSRKRTTRWRIPKLESLRIKPQFYNQKILNFKTEADEERPGNLKVSQKALHQVQRRAQREEERAKTGGTKEIWEVSGDKSHRT